MSSTNLSRLIGLGVVAGIARLPVAAPVAAAEPEPGRGLVDAGSSILVPLLGGAGLAAVGLLLVLIARKVRSH